MIKLVSPSEFLHNIKRRISPEQRLAFFSALVLGFVCHLFIITNSMGNSDDIRYLYVSFDKPELGRWLQTYIAGFSSYYSLPVVNAVLGIVYLSLAAAVMVSLLGLKNRISIVLTAGILVMFPAVTAIFAFTFTIDAFMFSAFLSVLSVYAAAGDFSLRRFVTAALFLCMSVGIYQAYLPFSLVLMLLCFVRELLTDSEKENLYFVKRAGWYLGVTALGMAAYYALMLIFLKIKHTDLSDYQNIGDSGIPGPSQLVHRVGVALADFKDFLKPGGVLGFNIWLLGAFWLCILLICVFAVVLIVHNKIYRRPLRLIFTVVCACLVPVALNVVLLISDGVNYHILMRHSYCIFFIAAAALFEDVQGFAGRRAKAAEWLVCAALFVAMHNYFLYDNICYFNMNFAYEKTYAMCIKVMDRIENSEDYDHHRPMAFIGNYSKTYRLEPLKELLEPMQIVKNVRVFGESSRNYKAFLSNYLGEDIEVVSPEEEALLRETQEFEEMPSFPDFGCVKVINDTTVIKFND